MEHARELPALLDSIATTNAGSVTVNNDQHVAIRRSDFEALCAMRGDPDAILARYRASATPGAPTLTAEGAPQPPARPLVLMSLDTRALKRLLSDDPQIEVELRTVAVEKVAEEVRRKIDIQAARGAIAAEIDRAVVAKAPGMAISQIAMGAIRQAVAGELRAQLGTMARDEFRAIARAEVAGMKADAVKMMADGAGKAIDAQIKAKVDALLSGLGAVSAA